MRTAKREARGYTAVEVLMGLALFAIGAAAVISMQRAAIQGNVDARKLDMANSIAHEWIERLRRDAALWTQPGPANPQAPSNYSSTSCPNPQCVQWPELLSTYLSAPAAGQTNPTVTTTWSFPDVYLKRNPQVPDGVSPGFDILGRDLAEADLPNAVFCVNVRLNWLVTPTDASGFARGGLIRAEVRVIWPKLLDAPPDAKFCSASNIANFDASDATSKYHFVYAVSAIRQNPAQ